MKTRKGDNDVITDSLWGCAEKCVEFGEMVRFYIGVRGRKPQGRVILVSASSC